MKALDKDRVSYFWDKIKKLVNKKTEKMVISSDNSVKDWVTITQEEFNNLKNNNQLIEGVVYNVLDGNTPAVTSVPVGTGMLWYGELDTLPDGLLPQDGRELDKNEYSSLFNILGYKYGGSGDKFNLPDIKGRVIVYPDGSTEFESLGSTGGEKEHQLTTNEMPSHTHGTRTLMADINQHGGWGSEINQITTQSYIAAPSRNDNIMSTGGDQSHNNIQPYICAYYVIKAKEDIYIEDIKNLDTYATDLKNTFEDATKHLSSGVLGGITFWPNSLDTLPVTYKVCNGQELNIKDYPQLFKIIGTRYGGNGISTFKLPDLSEHTLIGLGGEYTVLGQKIGQKTHIHTLSNGYAMLDYSDGDYLCSNYIRQSDPWKVNYYVPLDIPGRDPSKVGLDIYDGTQLGGSTDQSSNIQPSFVGYYIMKVLPDLTDESNELLQNLLNKINKLESIPGVVIHSNQIANESLIPYSSIILNWDNIEYNNRSEFSTELSDNPDNSKGTIFTCNETGIYSITINVRFTDSKLNTYDITKCDRGIFVLINDIEMVKTWVPEFFRCGISASWQGQIHEGDKIKIMAFVDGVEDIGIIMSDLNIMRIK